MLHAHCDNLCSNCAKESSELQLCGGCKTTQYCSQKCASDHWKGENLHQYAHQNYCAKVKAIDDYAKSNQGYIKKSFQEAGLVLSHDQKTVQIMGQTFDHHDLTNKLYENEDSTPLDDDDDDVGNDNDDDDDDVEEDAPGDDDVYSIGNEYDDDDDDGGESQILDDEEPSIEDVNPNDVDNTGENDGENDDDDDDGDDDDNEIPTGADGPAIVDENGNLMQAPDIIQKMIETELFAAKHISEWIFDDRSQSWYDAKRNLITFGDLGNTLFLHLQSQSDLWKYYLGLGLPIYWILFGWRPFWWRPRRFFGNRYSFFPIFIPRGPSRIWYQTWGPRRNRYWRTGGRRLGGPRRGPRRGPIVVGGGGGRGGRGGGTVVVRPPIVRPPRVVVRPPIVRPPRVVVRPPIVRPPRVIVGPTRRPTRVILRPRPRVLQPRVRVAPVVGGGGATTIRVGGRGGGGAIRVGGRGGGIRRP